MRISDFKYKVSFNCCYGEYELGDTEEPSIEYVGNDLNQLIEEVIEDDPDYPLRFEEIAEGDIAGLFFGIEDNDLVAVLFVNNTKC